MKERIQYRNEVNAVLGQIDPGVLSYDESEFWTIQSVYAYIEHYALENGLVNTAIALPLARGLHNGTHRKSTLTRNGKAHRIPYVFHCLIVCRILIDLNPMLSKEEIDILLAAALCHDMIEDIPFPKKGTELYEDFHLDPRVYETVKLVSKRDDFTDAEEAEFFHGIESNKLSLLIKLADRSHNVEDLYNRSVWKIHEYIGETNRFYLPMCAYGLSHYSDLAPAIEILLDKIVCLTGTCEILVDRGDARVHQLEEEATLLREENARLREAYRKLWEG